MYCYRQTHGRSNNILSLILCAVYTSIIWDICAVYKSIIWDIYELPQCACKFLNDIVAEFPESHGALQCTHCRWTNQYNDRAQMEYVATLRGVKSPKWHEICSMHNAYTLIDTLRNAKVNAQTCMVHLNFAFCVNVMLWACDMLRSYTFESS